MNTSFARFALASSLPAFLVGLNAAKAEQTRLLTSADIAQALTSRDYFNCRSDNEGNDIAQSHCTTMRRPNKITFEQFLCVEYGADSDRNPLARCVFKGQKRSYPNPLGAALIRQRDGTVDLIYKAGYWLIYND